MTSQIITILVSDSEGREFRVDFERETGGPIEDLVRFAAQQIINDIKKAEAL